MKIFLAGASGVIGRSLVPQGLSLMRPGYPDRHRGMPGPTIQWR
jgi:hypothetical protein